MKKRRTKKKTRRKRTTTKKKATEGRRRPRGEVSLRKPGTFRKGKDPRRGVGKKGRSGRVPTEIKVDCQEAVFSIALPKIIRYLSATRKGPSDAGWRWAVDRLFDRGFGRVPLPITGDDEGDPIAVRVERAAALKGRLLERLARIAEREETRK